jgi:hypothetical protein
MNRPVDDLLKSDEFKAKIAAIDQHAVSFGLDLWAARIVWVGLAYNMTVLTRYARRRKDYETSEAWVAYTRIIDSGIFSLDPEGICYEPKPKWEDGAGPHDWLNALIVVASGGEIDPDLL